MKYFYNLRRLCSVLAVGLMAAGPAWALFEDDQARRAVLELREDFSLLQNRIAVLESEAAGSRRALAAAAIREDDLRQHLARNNGRVEELKNEIDQLKNALQDMGVQLAELMQRQGQANEIAKKYGPVDVVIDGKTFTVEQQEKRQFEAAVESFRGGDYDSSVSMFKTFLLTYPRSPFSYSVRYWLGNALYAQRDCSSAIRTLDEAMEINPEHVLTPDILLVQATCHAEQRRTTQAKKLLDRVIKDYSETEAATIAKKRRSSL